MPIDTREARIARWESILSMREAGMTYKAIGKTFDPPLGQERVRQILTAGVPGEVGRPPKKEEKPA